MHNLGRTIGSNLGNAIVNSVLTHNVRVNHAGIASYVTAFDQPLKAPHFAALLSPFTAHGSAALDSVVNQQAQVIALMMTIDC